MNVECQDCGHKFYLRGNALETIVGGGGCENCGGKNIYRQQPTPLNSEMTERNMPLDGKHPDTGGNPLQEGIYADNGWEPAIKRDESFAASKQASDLMFDFGEPAQTASHTVVVTPEGRVHSLEGQVPHEQVATHYGLHQQNFPTAMSLGYVNPDNSTSWFQHDSGLQPEQLSSALSQHLGSNYGINVPITVDPNLKPSTNEGRWFGDQGFRGPNQRELDILNGPALPRPNRPVHPNEKEWAIRGGSVNRDTLNMEPYVPWQHQADAEVPATDPSGMYSATVTPGEYGIHAGTNHWLKFFNAHVNGLNAREHGNEIFSRYGNPQSEEFRQPVTVSVHHPDHLPAVVEAVENSIQGNQPSPEVQRVGRAIQAGEIPYPPGMGPQNVRQGHTKTAEIAPLLPLVGELAGGGAAAAGGEAAGGDLAGMAGKQLLKGALFQGGKNLIGGPGGSGGAPQEAGGAPSGPSVPEDLPAPPAGYTGSTHEADIPGKIDTPSSVPRMPTTDDPQAIDPHELNDGTQNKTQYGGDAEAGGSQGVPDFDQDDVAEIGRLQDKLLHYYHSPNSGLEDPELRALHERLEAKQPGYLERIPDDPHAAEAVRSLAQPPGVTAHTNLRVEGSRIMIRDVTPDDQNQFVRFAQTNKSFHHPFAQPPTSESEFAAYLQHRRLIAVTSKDSGDLIGLFTLHQDGPDAEVGVAIDEHHARQGYISEASDLLKQAAKTLGIRRWIAKADPANHKSINLLKKRGYTHQEGKLWIKWVEPLKEAKIYDPYRLSAWVESAQPMPGTYPVQPSTGTPMGIQPQTAPQPQPGLGQQGVGAGRCPQCGGVTTADGSCPQCGAKMNPMNAPTAPAPGGNLMPTPYAASVHEADAAGPVTDEQRAAVAHLLVSEGRAEELPIMEAKPWLYAKELARVKHDPDEPPPPVDPNQITPPPAQEVAPPGATMPVPDPSQQMSASTLHEATPVDLSQVIATAVARFSADGYAPRCPRCHSGTTGYQNTKGDCFCHSCRNVWNPSKDNIVERKIGAPEDRGQGLNTPSIPAADQHAQRNVEDEEDSSGVWQDTNGNRLETGQSYYLHTPQYQIPDLVRIDKIKPDGITVTNIGDVVNPQHGDSDTLNYSYDIGLQDLEMDNLTFEPADDSEQPSDFSDQRNNVQDVTGPNTEPAAPRVQTSSSLNEESEEPEEEHSCPECGEQRRIASTMSSPTTVMHDCYRCAHVWETHQEDDGTDGSRVAAWVLDDDPLGDDFSMPPRMARGGTSRSIAEAASRDSVYQRQKEISEANHQERIAGQKYTPREKRDFIDEDGVARNSDRLDLSGTHYEGTYRTRDADYGRGDLVPEEHLILGL